MGHSNEPWNSVQDCVSWDSLGVTSLNAGFVQHTHPVESLVNLKHFCKIGLLVTLLVLNDLLLAQVRCGPAGAVFEILVGSEWVSLIEESKPCSVDVGKSLFAQKGKVELGVWDTMENIFALAFSSVFIGPKSMDGELVSWKVFKPFFLAVVEHAQSLSPFLLEGVEDFLADNGW